MDDIRKICLIAGENFLRLAEKPKDLYEFCFGVCALPDVVWTGSFLVPDL